MKKYTLSDAEMLEINNAIDKANTAPDVIFQAIMGTWKAILAQDGTFFSEYVDTHGALNPTDFGIPEDQKLEIAERMKTRLLALTISPIGITNALIDFTVQYGPSQYAPTDTVELTDFPYVGYKPRILDV